MPFWHPKGMVIWNALEDLRRRENAKRGYVEVKTPLLYDVETWMTSGHWEKFRDDMFLVPYGEDRTLGLKPMNCPGHMLLFGSDLRSYRELPLRYAESSTLHRNERAGTLHGLLRVQHVTQDDAHIFVTPEQIEDEIFALPRLRRVISTTCSRWRRASSSRRVPRTSSAPTRSGTSRRARSARRSNGTGIEYVLNEGDGAFYGPKIDLHMTDVLGRSWQMGTIQLDSQMPARFGLTYVGEDNAEHTPYVVHRALLRLARALHGDPHRALRRRVPGLARAGAGARDPGRAWITGTRRRRWPRSSASSASRSTTPTRPSASGSATPRSRRSRTSSSGATRSPTTRSRSASMGESSRRGRSTSSWSRCEKRLRFPRDGSRGEIPVLGRVVEQRLEVVVVELRAGSHPASGGDEPRDLIGHGGRVVADRPVSELGGRAHVEHDRMRRVPRMSAKGLVGSVVQQHLLPDVVELPRDRARDLQCARRVGIGAVQDSPARFRRDHFDERGEVRCGRRVVDAGASPSQEDGGAPIEHSLDEDPLTRCLRARAVDLGGPEHGDGLAAREQNLLGGDLVRAVALT